MIGISKLYCGAVEPSDALRYGRESGQLPSHLLQFSKDKKPVVVWNMTQRCNLKCVHCYAHAVDPSSQQDPISNEKAKEIIDDLAQFGAPVMLFSGGEPLVREDLVDLAKYATSKGMRAVISTNGTLITKSKARELKEVGLSYVGISLDGAEEVHDKFRGVKGAYKKALQGVENCQAEGLKVGLRFTINKRNAQEVPHLFDLIERLEVPRICFYHLVYSGRGSDLMKEDLDHQETRDVVNLIMDRTRALFDKGLPKEVLTVDNHADGPHLYYRMLKEDPARAAEVLELLKMNEGNSSGRGIGCISWDGQVHADQFMRHITFGNVLERPFSEIWTDPKIELLQKLKDKRPHVKGRCATCRFLNICGGNFRARAEAVYDDFWAQDPACYLTDEEISGEKL
jgi:12,18-didecarboxysiroheme deacetylase